MAKTQEVNGLHPGVFRMLMMKEISKRCCPEKLRNFAKRGGLMSASKVRLDEEPTMGFDVP
jgi:hypothetical protein